MEIGIHWLRPFWSAHVNGPADGADWVAGNTLLAGLGLGLRETFDYFYSRRPSFEEFEAWIVDKRGGAPDPSLIERLNAALPQAALSQEALSQANETGQPADPSAEPALSAADLAFWNENGYIVVPDAVPETGCRAAIEAICEFTGVRLDRPDTWYGGPQGHSIWIPLLHHPALQANRDSPRIHRAFAQIWGREDLWGNVDQAGFNPPERKGWQFPGPHLHWDVSLARPIPFGVQGILYLADTAANQGAFTCVPGFHRRIDAWLDGLPAGADPRRHDFASQAVPVPGRAGDLVIWHQALPHGSSPNRAELPRLAQYLVKRPSRWGWNPVWL